MTATQTAPKPRTRSIILRLWESAAMAAGRVTQLRRVVTPQPTMQAFTAFTDPIPWMPIGGIHQDRWECPFGRAGDVLACKETWAKCGKNDGHTLYRADDGKDFGTCHPVHPVTGVPDYRWRSPATMPAYAVRFRPVIAAVRVERCNAITWDDALAMGVERIELTAGQSVYPWYAIGGVKAANPISAAATLFVAKHGQEAWDAATWMWVLDLSPNG